MSRSHLDVDPPSKIALAIIARNEAHQIAQCVASARGVDELIIVVDAESTDDTASRALALGADVTIVQGTLGALRAAAFARCKAPWVLALDADERLPPDGLVQFRAAIERAPAAVSAFRVPIRTYIGNRFIRWGGLYPAARPRLYRRRSVRWNPNEAVHETAILEGRCASLPVDIEHFGFTDLGHYRRKQAKYAQWAAAALLKRGIRQSVSQSALRAAWRFMKVAVIRGGWLMGRLGWRLAFVQAQAAWQRGALTRAGASSNAFRRSGL